MTVAGAQIFWLVNAFEQTDRTGDTVIPAFLALRRGETARRQKLTSKKHTTQKTETQ
jgi:hypothetical protein